MIVAAEAVQEAAVAVPPPQASLKPNTTLQEDMTTAGQRRVNLIWEYTQAAIALMVVMTNLAVGIMLAIQHRPFTEYPFVLSSSLFLIIGFYFSRTNHAAIGGIGGKPVQQYEGR